MTKERWEDLVGMIKDKFEVSEQGQTPRPDGHGTVEFIEFRGPLGMMRCELNAHGVITGKRAIGGHKVGSGSKVQYDYDDSEQVNTFKAYKQVSGEWQEIDASMFEHA